MADFEQVASALIDAALANPSMTDVEALGFLSSVFGWTDSQEIGAMMWSLGFLLDSCGFTDSPTWASARDTIGSMGLAKATAALSVISQSIEASEVASRIVLLTARQAVSEASAIVADIDSGTPTQATISAALACYRDATIRGSSKNQRIVDRLMAWLA